MSPELGGFREKQPLLGTICRARWNGLIPSPTECSQIGDSTQGKSVSKTGIQNKYSKGVLPSKDPEMDTDDVPN